jgi:hypothetical protein
MLSLVCNNQYLAQFPSNQTTVIREGFPLSDDHTRQRPVPSEEYLPVFGLVLDESRITPLRARDVKVGVMLRENSAAQALRGSTVSSDGGYSRYKR